MDLKKASTYFLHQVTLALSYLQFCIRICLPILQFILQSNGIIQEITTPLSINKSQRQNSSLILFGSTLAASFFSFTTTGGCWGDFNNIHCLISRLTYQIIRVSLAHGSFASGHRATWVVVVNDYCPTYVCCWVLRLWKKETTGCLRRFLWNLKIRDCPSKSFWGFLLLFGQNAKWLSQNARKS